MNDQIDQIEMIKTDALLDLRAHTGTHFMSLYLKIMMSGHGRPRAKNGRSNVKEVMMTMRKLKERNTMTCRMMIRRLRRAKMSASKRNQTVALEREPSPGEKNTNPRKTSIRNPNAIVLRIPV